MNNNRLLFYQLPQVKKVGLPFLIKCFLLVGTYCIIIDLGITAAVKTLSNYKESQNNDEILLNSNKIFSNN